MIAAEDRLRDLLVRGLAGDAAAYHVFLKELSAHLRAFLRRRLSGLPDEVEDLVQEALLAVHNQRHTYDAGQPLTAWLHAIARYKLVDLLRRRGTRRRAQRSAGRRRSSSWPPPTAKPRTRAVTWRSCSTPCPTGSGCRSST